LNWDGRKEGSKWVKKTGEEREGNEGREIGYLPSFTGWQTSFLQKEKGSRQ